MSIHINSLTNSLLYSLTHSISRADSLYRLLQSTTQFIIGPSSYVEYGPLIAGGLLRFRLELCVIESFYGESTLNYVIKSNI